MIGHLRGHLLQKTPPFLLLDVGGVGYEVEAPLPTFYDLPEAGAGGEVALFVHQVVRDDAHLLFGFLELRQRDLFRGLLRVSGIGPRVGLAILSTLSAAELTACIARGDVDMLTRVPGIGKKTAQRMILDLRDRVDLEADAAVVEGDAGGSPVQDALSALLALGYKAGDARRALDAVKGHGDGREELIRKGLRRLSGG